MLNNANRFENKPSFHLNIGSSSILMIFVTLCLVAFAALSTVSAMADSRLNSRVLERTSAYYEACNRAESALSDLDGILSGLYASAPSAEAYYQTAGRSKTYDFTFSDLQMLRVTVEILYPVRNDDCFYRITGWQVITTGELN